jgi:hypothetical protein
VPPIATGQKGADGGSGDADEDQTTLTTA